MADFSTADARFASAQSAGMLLQNIRSLYQIGKQIAAVKAQYQAGTDPALNAMLDAFYTGPQSAELVQMINQVTTLTNDWETNHKSAIGVS
jgi:hypothetical protein